jgi:hypothetical protein
MLAISLLGYLLILQQKTGLNFRKNYAPEAFFVISSFFAFYNLKNDPNMRTSVIYSIFVCAVFFFFRILSFSQGEIANSKRNGVEFRAIWLISLGSLIQIYPTFDARHAFWAGLWICLLSIHEFFSISGKRGLFPFLLIMTFLVSAFHADYRATAPKDFQTVLSSNILNGMKVTSEQLLTISEIDNFYNDLPQENSYIFRCFDGVYSVWKGNYLSADKFWGDWPWQWAIANHQIERQVSYSKRPDIILCTDKENAKNWAADNGYRIIKSIDFLSLARWGQ